MILKTIGIVAAVALVGVLGVAATRPDSFQVQRSASVQAPPERLYALINDLHQFNTWNPYAQKDPAMRTSYSGPAAGPGAGFAFEGNQDVGKGTIQILDSRAPSEVTMRLHMLEPFEGKNTVVFRLEPRGGATEVSWRMEGPSPYISKLVGLFLDMDRMIGRDFEAGLSALKARAEKS